MPLSGDVAPLVDQHVTITGEAPRLSIRALMDAEPPQITAGYGGWEEVQRPGRQALVHWTGVAAYRMTLSLVLDGWADARSVEQECHWLEWWAESHRAFSRPSRIKVEGRAVPKSSLWWAIDELGWGETLRNAVGERQRQRVSLTLVQATDPTGTVKVVYPTLANTASGRTVRLAPPGGLVALQRLAAHELGKARYWKSIAVLNGIRTPAAVKTGTVLRLP